MQKKEENLQIAVSKYLRYKYPNVIFTSESSGIRVSIGTAKKMKMQRSNHKLPDMIILYPNIQFKGLIMELKKDIKEVYRADGTLSQSKHIQEQKRSLDILSNLGYKALFVCGIDEAINTIEIYMNS